MMKKESEVFLSIVIPVYNAADYLPITLAKLTLEISPDNEVIIIDDGSTDTSLSICREFASSRPYFKVFTQSNAGPSAARNRGLKLARGRYVTFLDADDEFSPDTLSAVCHYLRMQDSEIVFLQVERVNAQNERSYSVEYKELQKISGNELRRLWCRNSTQIRGFLWGKIYSQTLLDGIIFPEDMRFAEDMYSLSEILMKTQTAVFFPEGSYLYYERPGTPTTGTWTVAKSRCLLKAYIHRWQCAITYALPIDDQIQAWAQVLALFCAERKTFSDENWADIRNQLKANNYSMTRICRSTLGLKCKLGLLRNMLLL